MSFMKRTTFTDSLEQEIYIFKMFLDLGEYLYGMNINRQFYYKKGIITIKSVPYYNSIVYSPIGDQFLFNDIELVELETSCEVLDNPNLHWRGIWFLNRNKKSDHYGEYELFHHNDIDDDSDIYMNDYLSGGINNVTEESLFQYSLVTTDEIPTLEEINRVLEVLSIKTTLERDNVQMYHESGANKLTIDEFNELYDLLLDIILEPQYGIR